MQRHATRKLPSREANPGRPRLLLVEDELALRTTFVRMIGDDFDVTAVADGSSAAELLVRKTFDVVLSDIGLPGMSGVDLLRLVRCYDLDVPVILMTGKPSVDNIAAAIELGALTCLEKPIDRSTLIHALDRAAKLSRVAQAKREAVAAGFGSSLSGDRVGLETAFERALKQVWIAFQPIVDTRSKKTVAFEAFMRTDEPSIPSPIALLRAAERLDRLRELGAHVRERIAASFQPQAPDTMLFVNLHASDLTDPALYRSDAPLSAIASRVVFEVTERAALETVRDVRRHTQQLRALGFRIALDDLGAGYAGLTSFATLEPEVVKLDMSLIRGIDSSPVRFHIVDTIARLCGDLGMLVVAEGIETPAELNRMLELGCDYVQGVLLGQPQREPRPSSWVW